MLYEDNIKVIKFWFSISKEEQKKRFESRLENPLKRWKFSPVDQKGQVLWDDYTKYKKQMFSKTHTNFSPWIIVKANDKKQARLESIRYVLSQFDYSRKGVSKATLLPDPNVVMRYHSHLTHPRPYTLPLSIATIISAFIAHEREWFITYFLI